MITSIAVLVDPMSLKGLREIKPACLPEGIQPYLGLFSAMQPSLGQSQQLFATSHKDNCIKLVAMFSLNIFLHLIC